MAAELARYRCSHDDYRWPVEMHVALAQSRAGAAVNSAAHPEVGVNDRHAIMDALAD